MFMKKSNIMISHEKQHRVHIMFDTVMWEGDRIDMGRVVGGE